MTAISGNTYPVKEALKALGAKWNADKKVWMVPDNAVDQAKKLVNGGSSAPYNKPFSYSKCQTCGVQADRYTKIYRSGECRVCYEERKMGD
jgi:hypothetical protein